MDRYAWRRPVGPLPAGVYWWRRLAALAALIAVIVLAALVARTATGGGSGGSAAVRTTSTVTAGSSQPTPPRATSASGAPTTTPAVTPTTTTTATTGTPPVGLKPCAVSTLTLTASASADSYPAHTAPTFAAVLATTGPACRAPGPVSFVVDSGADRIWANTDCAPAAGSPTVLAARGGAAVQRTWQRVRSNPGCASVAGSTAALPGTYRVSASWAGVSSKPVVFTLL